MNQTGVLKKTVVFEKVNKKSKAKQKKAAKNNSNANRAANNRGTIVSLFNKQSIVQKSDDAAVTTERFDSRHGDIDMNDNNNDNSNKNRKRKSSIVLPTPSLNLLQTTQGGQGQGDNPDSSNILYSTKIDLNDQINVWNFNLSVAKSIKNNLDKTKIIKNRNDMVKSMIQKKALQNTDDENQMQHAISSDPQPQLQSNLFDIDLNQLCSTKNNISNKSNNNTSSSFINNLISTKKCHNNKINK